MIDKLKTMQLKLNKKGIIPFFTWFLIWLFPITFLSIKSLSPFVTVDNFSLVILIATIISYIVLFLIYMFFTGDYKFIKTEKINLKQIGIGAIGAIIIYVFSTLIALIIGFFAPFETQADNVKLLTGLTPVLTILFGGIILPIFEELMFRGLFYNLLSDYYDRVFILFSSIIFGLCHIQNTEDVGMLINSVLFSIMAGFFFASMYRKTNSIYTSMTAHVLYNTSVLLLTLYLASR